LKLHIIAVGQRMPAWIAAGFEEYARRMPRTLPLRLVEIRPEPRGAAVPVERLTDAEAKRIGAALPAGGDHDATAFNIGTGGQRSVLELAAEVGRVLGVEPVLEHEAPRAGELFRSALDASRARRVLGWEPGYAFEQGLGELVDWFASEETRA
jgi:nucleoside-diphosphate-sugar epimerase